MSFTQNALINAALVLACLVVVLACAARIRELNKRHDAPHDTAMRAAHVDVSMEYQVCLMSGYTARAARSHARAYIARRYAFLNGDERAHVLRAGLQHAQMHINARNNNNNKTLDGAELIKAI